MIAGCSTGSSARPARSRRGSALLVGPLPVTARGTAHPLRHTLFELGDVPERLVEAVKGPFVELLFRDVRVVFGLHPVLFGHALNISR